MKDFTLRNDTKLLFRNEPKTDLAELVAHKRILFVYSPSAKTNGCYDDIKATAQSGNAIFNELCASRELECVEAGISLAKKQGIELIIGAGGASVMDCAKLIAFGVCNEMDLKIILKARKAPMTRKNCRSSLSRHILLAALNMDLGQFGQMQECRTLARRMESQQISRF